MLFNVGLPKTGTTSLHAALTALGVRSTHDVHLARELLFACEAGDVSAALHLTSDVEAVTHFPRFTVNDFVRVRAVFPDAVWCCTTRRDRHEWLASRTLHALDLQVRRLAGEASASARRPPITPDASTEQWEREWEGDLALRATMGASLGPSRFSQLPAGSDDLWARLTRLLDASGMWYVPAVLSRPRHEDVLEERHTAPVAWPRENDSVERARRVLQYFEHKATRR